MSNAGKQLLESAGELVRFADGEDVGPMTLYMPDGDGGMVRRGVANISEYRAIWYQEGLRVFNDAQAQTRR